MSIAVYNDAVLLYTLLPFPHPENSNTTSFRPEHGTTDRSGRPVARTAGTPCVTAPTRPDNC